MTNPILLNDPSRTREFTLFAAFCSLLCLGLLAFVAVGSSDWLVIAITAAVCGVPGLLFVCALIMSTLKVVSPRDAAFTWLVSENGLMPATPGWYCLLRSRNTMLSARKELSIEIYHRPSSYFENGRMVHVDIIFHEDVPSPETIEAFRAWYPRLVVICSYEHLQSMQKRINQDQQPYIGQFEERITTDPIDTFVRRASPTSFHASLRVHEWRPPPPGHGRSV